MKYLPLYNSFNDFVVSQQTLNKQIDTNKKEVFYFVQDHITNHRAKANLYVRIADIKPPGYGYF